MRGDYFFKSHLGEAEACPLRLVVHPPWAPVWPSFKPEVPVSVPILPLRSGQKDGLPAPAGLPAPWTSGWPCPWGALGQPPALTQ